MSKLALYSASGSQMRLNPESYWVLFGDAFISRNHHRVLDHIKMLSESDATWA